MRGWAPYVIPDLPTWHTNRVLVIGDAAHCIPPYSGQGTAQALEDAGYLARLLSNKEALQKGYAAAFERLEKRRKRRFEHVRQLTARSGKAREATNSFIFFLKKHFLRIYFGLYEGGYLRDERILQYDVNEEPLQDEQEGGEGEESFTGE